MNGERVALIAGASGAIGGAVAHRLSLDGIVTYLGYCCNAERAATVAKEIIQRGGVAEALALDLRDAAAPDDVCQRIFDARGRLDILVNCVAVNVESPALGMDDSLWQQVLDTNLSGAFRLCRAAGKYMVVRRWGRIVNVSSIAAMKGGRGQINYAASKAALEAMTRVLALELGGKGVLANCVAPGAIETSMSARLRNEHNAAILDGIALHRFGQPAEVAEAVAFLVSGAAGYITGQVIRVDGGMGI